MAKCDTTFVPADGDETFTCEREDTLHLKHRDSGGTTAIKVPGGALISTKIRHY